MRKRLAFAAFFSVLLAATAVVAVYAQAQTIQPSQDEMDSTDVVTYGKGGAVIIQVPNGSSSHPLDLKITVEQINETSDYGGPNVMIVSVWVQNLNMYMPVAVLSTNTDPDAITWIQGVLNNTAVWTPTIMENYFIPTAEEYQIGMLGDMMWANLTTSYNVTLPETLGGNFTIPPMTIMFVPIADGFSHEETSMFPSGWATQSMHTDVPVWVRITIPMWVANSPIETVGTMIRNGTTIYMPPST